MLKNKHQHWALAKSSSAKTANLFGLFACLPILDHWRTVSLKFIDLQARIKGLRLNDKEPFTWHCLKRSIFIRKAKDQLTKINKCFRNGHEHACGVWQRFSFVFVVCQNS